MKRHVQVFSLVICIVLLSACHPSGQNNSKTNDPTNNQAYIENKGSDTLVNLALAWAERYQQLNPDVQISVTGGGSGLGKSMTKYFLELGADVVITSRKLKRLEQTAKELTEETGGNVLPVQCDVRKYEQVEQMLEATLKHFGKVDALLNNAAGNFISPTERLSAHAFDTIIDIVLKGTKNCTLAFGKHWIQKKQNATILNIVTTYAWTGSAYVVPSATAKAGVLAMTRSLAVEWAKYNIRINAIAPGPFPTKGAWDRLLPGDLKEKFDVILLNPPQTAGKKICFRMIEESKEHLNKGGSLQLVARHQKGGRSLQAKMEEVFGNVKVIARGSGYRIYYSELLS